MCSWFDERLEVNGQEFPRFHKRKKLFRLTVYLQEPLEGADYFLSELLLGQKFNWKSFSATKQLSLSRRAYEVASDVS